jgi:hypothetical protein
MNSLKKEDVKSEDVMKIKTVVEYIHEKYDDILNEYKNDDTVIEYWLSKYAIYNDPNDPDYDDSDCVPDDVAISFVEEYIREKNINIYNLLTELSKSIVLPAEYQVIEYIFDDYRVDKFEIDTIMKNFLQL